MQYEIHLEKYYEVNKHGLCLEQSIVSKCAAGNQNKYNWKNRSSDWTLAAGLYTVNYEAPSLWPFILLPEFYRAKKRKCMLLLELMSLTPFFFILCVLSLLLNIKFTLLQSDILCHLLPSSVRLEPPINIIKSKIFISCIFP